MTINNMDVNDNNIVLEKGVNKDHVIVGDIIKYSISVFNEGDVLINNITIIDTLATELQFEKCSVIVENIPLPDENVLAGVDIGSLKPGETKMLTFKAKVISRPRSGYIQSSAIAKFNYNINLNSMIISRPGYAYIQSNDIAKLNYNINLKDNLEENLVIMDKKSNEVLIKVDVAQIEIIKTADKKLASRGDVISYEIKLINVGTIQARNIVFSDKLPKELGLVNNVFEVNGKIFNNISSDINVYVGNIQPGEYSIVKYRAIIKSANCSELLANNTKVKFNYNLCKDSFGEKVDFCEEDKVSEVQLGITTFKQLSIDENLCIPCQKPDIKEMNDIMVDSEVLECHVIKTPLTKSNEGQILSGYKLIVRGTLKVLMEYTSNTAEQSVHSAYYVVPFSSFVILPQNYVLGSKIDVEAKVEDVYYKQIDCRSFFKNTTLLINVKVILH